MSLTLLTLYSGMGSSIVGEIASTWGLYALVDGESCEQFYIYYNYLIIWKFTNFKTEMLDKRSTLTYLKI